MPGADTVLVVAVLPAPQSKVAPAVVDEAVKVTLLTIQVSDAGCAMLPLVMAPI